MREGFAWIAVAAPFSRKCGAQRTCVDTSRWGHLGYAKGSRRARLQPLHVIASIASGGDSATSEPAARWKGDDIDTEVLVSQVKFNSAGLVPAIAQQWDTGEVLMLAWMSAESIRETMRGGRAVYYSRSRKQLWRKGDTSGQIQVVQDILLDCDGDTILVKVDQRGVACHTGRRSCFYTAFRPPTGEPQIIADVLMDPKELYKTSK